MPAKPTTPKDQQRRARSRRRAEPGQRPLFRWLVLAALLGAGAAAGYVAHLDRVIVSRFEGRRWALPSRVYGRALELHRGLRVSAEAFARELEVLGYRNAPLLEAPGTYVRDEDVYRLRTRPFVFWDGSEPSRLLRVSFRRQQVEDLFDLESGAAVDIVRLDPPLVGSFYPDHHEDRVLVRLAELPGTLPAALIALEDRNFRGHWGVDPRGVARALWANLQAGRVVQGGSTLTQQLVKNYFLTAERTWWRKAKEAVMAVLLEAHYGKEEILEAYLNEIYLGQQDARAIHGVGLASQFCFGRPVGELDLPRIALLVGMVRGPSQYDPRRHPVQARQRRDHVLDVLVTQEVVSAQEAATAKRSPLGVIPDPPHGTSRYPAFMDLVRRQLREHYREQDLREEGLRVFATLDPRLQAAAEGALVETIRRLERQGRVGDGPLEGALVVVSPQTGEVQALVGGREVRYHGFNRALDAKRPIGSLVKPAVFLSALEQPGQFTLATAVDDAPLTVPQEGGEVWTPSNYDGQTHGAVSLYEALTRSHNLATARLGLQLGVPRILRTLQRLGVEREVAPYPAVLLGAVELSPLEVSALYQTIANGGFRVPARGVREVLNREGRPLERYPLAVEQTVEPAPLYLLTAALEEVVQGGTAVPLRQALPEGFRTAGKTGTTNDLRDSWYAGFTADWLAVAWLGLDDNRPCGLSGSTGALEVWAEFLARAGGESLATEPPPGVTFAWVDRVSGRGARRGDPGAVRLPFAEGSVPGDADRGRAGVWESLRGLFRGEQP